MSSRACDCERSVCELQTYSSIEELRTITLRVTSGCWILTFLSSNASLKKVMILFLSVVTWLLWHWHFLCSIEASFKNQRDCSFQGSYPICHMDFCFLVLDGDIFLFEAAFKQRTVRFRTNIILVVWIVCQSPWYDLSGWLGQFSIYLLYLSVIARFESFLQNAMILFDFRTLTLFVACVRACVRACVCAFSFLSVLLLCDVSYFLLFWFLFCL